jgi:hypothetical protein
MIPCAYIWVPFQLRRSLVAFALDLPIMSVHGAGAYGARKRRLQPDGAAHNSWLLSSRECGISALNEPDPAPRLGVPVPFGSAQPSHGCVRDTDQLVELPYIDITDAAAQENLVVN